MIKEKMFIPIRWEVRGEDAVYLRITIDSIEELADALIVS
jgi:hypothetical protein